MGILKGARIALWRRCVPPLLVKATSSRPQERMRARKTATWLLPAHLIASRVLGPCRMGLCTEISHAHYPCRYPDHSTAGGFAVRHPDFDHAAAAELSDRHLSGFDRRHGAMASCLQPDRLGSCRIGWNH